MRWEKGPGTGGRETCACAEETVRLQQPEPLWYQEDLANCLAAHLSGVWGDCSMLSGRRIDHVANAPTHRLLHLHRLELSRHPV